MSRVRSAFGSKAIRDRVVPGLGSSFTSDFSGNLVRCCVVEGEARSRSRATDRGFSSSGAIADDSAHDVYIAVWFFGARP